MKELGILLVLMFTCNFACAVTDEQGYNSQTIRTSDIPKDAPTFSEYSVGEAYKGPVALPDVRSHPESRMFKTRIREGAKLGPNFAGHYTLVFWGCGTGCSAAAIVDAKTGKVFHPKNLSNFDNINVAYEELEPPEGTLIKYRRDSRLIIVIGGINEEPALRGISYFVWKNEGLRRIRFVPKPYE